VQSSYRHGLLSPFVQNVFFLVIMGGPWENLNSRIEPVLPRFFHQTVTAGNLLKSVVKARRLFSTKMFAKLYSAQIEIFAARQVRKSFGLSDCSKDDRR
jgi:hypothetical protein